MVAVPETTKLIPEAPYELVEKMRASIVVLGPLLARCGRAKVSMPGGDDFGSRPIDIHISGLERMGATFGTHHGYVEGEASDQSGRLVGAHLVLEYPSHTATDNLLMAAALAKGTTVIENAAREPEVSDLAAMLTARGRHPSGDPRPRGGGDLRAGTGAGGRDGDHCRWSSGAHGDAAVQAHRHGARGHV